MFNWHDLQGRLSFFVTIPVFFTALLLLCTDAKNVRAEDGCPDKYPARFEVTSTNKHSLRKHPTLALLSGSALIRGEHIYKLVGVEPPGDVFVSWGGRGVPLLISQEVDIKGLSMTVDVWDASEEPTKHVITFCTDPAGRWTGADIITP